jgi:hypothetical protein
LYSSGALIEDKLGVQSVATYFAVMLHVGILIDRPGTENRGPNPVKPITTLLAVNCSAVERQGFALADGNIANQKI